MLRKLNVKIQSVAYVLLFYLTIVSLVSSCQNPFFTVKEIDQEFGSKALVSVISPYNGESLKASEAIVILWQTREFDTITNGITLEYSADGGLTWTAIAANTANDGAEMWTPPNDNSSNYRLRLTAYEQNGTVKAVVHRIRIDNTAPTISSIEVNSGVGTTSNNVINVQVTANDDSLISSITHVCLKYNNNIAPAASDSCWQSAPASSTLSSTFNLTLSNITLTYLIYAWVKDQHDYISTMSNSGLGTDGQDRDLINLDIGNPPVVRDILVSSIDSPTTASSHSTVPLGSDVYIKWNVSDFEGLPTNSVDLYYDTGTGEQLIASSVPYNAATGACTVNAATTADDSATGCYFWSSGSPTSGPYKVIVRATDDTSTSVAASSIDLNVSDIRFLAGNTYNGFGHTAKGALLINDMASNSATADMNSIAVASDGTIYFRDLSRGILKMDPISGIINQLVPDSTTSTGDGGLAPSATVRAAYKITVDHQDRLLILDYDRIRRIDPATNIITTIIGGGVDTSDVVADPLDVRINLPAGFHYSRTSYGPFFALPNGDIYFFDQYTWSGSPRITSGTLKYRKFNAGTGQVEAIRPVVGDTTISSSGSNPVNCVFMNFAMEYNPLTSVISQMHLTANSSYSCGYGSTLADPVTLATLPTNPPGGLNNAARVVGMNGRVYLASRYQARVKVYEPGTNSWTTLAGTGSTGQCDDGTLATSCPMDIQDVFVTKAGIIYISDRGRVRTIDSNGRIQTVAGQSFSFGDGGHPLSARFGLINDLKYWDDGGTLKFVVSDRRDLRIREFSIDGSINLLAGNGSSSTPNTTGLAADQGYPVNSAGNFWNRIAVNTGNGRVYSHRGGSYVSYIDRTTDRWVNAVGGGADTYSSATADGKTGNLISLPGYPAQLQAFGDNKILMMKHRYSGSHIDAMLKTYTETTFVQASLAGMAGATATDCADGVALNSCRITSSSTERMAMWDDTNSRWLYARVGTSNIRILTEGGTMATLATLPRTIRAFSYDETANTLYYCSNSTPRLYKYNVGTLTETALSWPLSNMSCAGYDMHYIPSRNSVIFIYQDGAIYGVAEHVNL